ncbi:uncharacterized protein EV154DRAFT_553928 [Mucor mucedo]|uniref:uncharacterized protein n=1 Tax=Mucor mucedo TaxID=29922 RepID=UPI00222005B9|nr:uncharacterized protein EV154DRAFT_553928 [Mucor mucedo]KAI7888340.1 hypothetical protein EV154DRAFT_553928 [Mucor mucedo]
MVLLPGLKTVYLVGNLSKNTPPSYTSGPADTPKKAYPQSSNLVGTVDVEYKSKDDATDKARILETEDAERKKSQLQCANTDYKDSFIKGSTRTLSDKEIFESAINFKQKISNNQRIKITRENYLCHEKVKIIVLDGRLTLNDSTFSVTDNGITTMTETSQFKVDHFKFPLDLQNRYSILSGSKMILILVHWTKALFSIEHSF